MCIYPNQPNLIRIGLDNFRINPVKKKPSEKKSMKSIFEKWKNIFKRNKKTRLREDVDYDPDSRDIEVIVKTPLRRRSRSVPKLFTESDSPK